MAKKIILTEEQHVVLINQILRETIQKIDYIEVGKKLDEGFWDSVKYGLSKLGRYKANGKIFGKGKIDQEAASKIQQIIDKQGNKLIRTLDSKIKEENPEFPNGKDPQQFLTTVMEIAAIYDSIVAATQKSSEENGYMPIDAANGVINDLREYTKKYLDTDLAAVYSGLDENEDNLGHDKIMNEEYTLDEEQLRGIDEHFGLSEEEEEEEETGLDAGDVRAGLQAKRGEESGEDFDSTRMDTLKSNKLPMTLVGVGASLGAFSWLVNTEWFKSLFDVVTKNPSIEYIKQAVQEKTEIFASIKPSEGMTQIMNRLNGLNLNPNSSPEDFINGVKTLGGGNVNDGINALTQQGGIFTDPEVARKALTEIVNNPHGHGDNLGQIFQGKWAGTGRSFGDSLVTQTGGGLKGIIVNTIIKAVPKLVIRTGVKTGAGYALAKGFGAVLGPIGIGLVTAGVLVKLFRMKGQKSSRAATLNSLYQSMRGLGGGVGLIPSPTGDDVAPAPTANTNVNAAEPTGDDVNARTGKQTGNGIGDITGINKNTDDVTPTNSGDANTPTDTNPATGTDTGAGTNPTTDTGSEDTVNNDLYNDLKNLFQFVVNNKKTMGSDVNTSTNNAAAQAPLNEGKFINDKNVLQYLTKTLGADKVKNFENLLTRVEYLRNVLKKMAGRTTDSNINNFLKQLNSNPIMLTKFSYLTEVNPKDPEDVKQLSVFINEVLLAIYSGNYKFGNMVDKMATLGGGNINKITEAAGYNALQPNDAFIDAANDMGKFKNNLVSFLTTIMGLFQYLHKSRGGEIARQDTSQQYTPQQKTNQEPQVAAPQVKKTAAPKKRTPKTTSNQTSLFESEDQKLMEEIKRIKKIMLS